MFGKKIPFKQAFSLFGLLILAIAIPFTANLARQNQENRSQAQIKNDDACEAKKGICQIFNKNIKEGSKCDIDGWAGKVVFNLCTGGNDRRCCVPYKDNGCKAQGGNCIKTSADTDSCSINGTNGKIVKNKCGGDSTIRCCVPSTVRSSSGGQATLTPTPKPSATPTQTPNNNTSAKIESVYSSQNHAYTGQLHTHSTNSDGRNSPKSIVTAYKNAGYDFISLTDHAPYHSNKSPSTNPSVEGILFIPGVEQACGPNGWGSGHINRINAKTAVQSTTTSATSLLNKANEDPNEIVFINHPNSPTHGKNYWPTVGLQNLPFTGIEIYNSGSKAEDWWDKLLTQGRKVWGFTSDDCHNYNDSDCLRTKTKVFANNLTKSEIIDNIKKGNFYSSLAPKGKKEIELNFSNTDDTITVYTSALSTIEFIGKNGKSLQIASNVNTASYKINGTEKYVRIKVSKSGGYTSWSNPFFIKN